MFSVAVGLLLVAGQPAGAMPPVLLKLDDAAASKGAAVTPPTEPDYRCATAYGDCFRVVRGDDNVVRLETYDMDPATAKAAPAMELPAELQQEEGNDRTELWDNVIRLKQGDAVPIGDRVYLIGLLRTDWAGYSGGSASSSRLHLFRLQVNEGGAALGPELLSVPWTSEAMIRACFGDDDMAKRGQACHDIYKYSPGLTLAAEEGADGFPVLLYQSVATSFPRTARRGEDSSSLPPLTAADLVEWRDPDCSMARRFTFNPLTGRYEADRAGPSGCESYWQKP